MRGRSIHAILRAEYIISFSMGVKHKVNESFFDCWHPGMAYVLGFLYADGSLEGEKEAYNNQEARHYFHKRQRGVPRKVEHLTERSRRIEPWQDIQGTQSVPTALLHQRHRSSFQVPIWERKRRTFLQEKIQNILTTLLIAPLKNRFRHCIHYDTATFLVWCPRS